MAILYTINLLITHPLTRLNLLKSIFRLLKWQISSKLNPYPIIYSFTTKSKLIIKKGMTGATGNLYFGLHEFEDMAFLLHFLREEDLFVDAGANIGSYTVLASAHVGCNSISIEPIPSTFEHLANNININKIGDKVQALNLGLGKEKGELLFTKSLDTENHIATVNDIDTIKIPVESIDNVISDKCPSLIKIDVEGFETELLNGAFNLLQNQALKAIIIELNGSGNRYGYDENNIHIKLLTLGFKPYEYLPFERKLIKKAKFGDHNTLYLRDLDFVSNRLINAQEIEILNHVF